MYMNIQPHWLTLIASRRFLPTPEYPALRRVAMRIPATMNGTAAGSTISKKMTVSLAQKA